MTSGEFELPWMEHLGTFQLHQLCAQAAICPPPSLGGFAPSCCFPPRASSPLMGHSPGSIEIAISNRSGLGQCRAPGPSARCVLV
jgi:hypothetical protein